MIYFTSDTHYNHKNICRFSNRPFKSVEEMNESLIENWNSVVKPEDTTYIIGDFNFGYASESKRILSRLNGSKNLIKGNHDKIEYLKDVGFGFIKDYYELNHEFSDGVKQKIVLCHYAMRVWNKSHYGSWNLYGHSHGSLAPVGKQIDVGVDAILKYKEWFSIDAGVKPYTPISIEQIRILLDSVDISVLDHHGD